MNDGDLSFNNTSVILHRSTTNIENIKVLKEQCSQFNISIEIEDDEEQNLIEIYNHPQLLLYEELYVDSVNFFKDILRKLSVKNYNDDLFYVNDDYSLERKRYEDSNIFFNVIQDNNIDGLSRNDLKISIEMLEALKKQSNKISKLINIYIMFFLASKSTFLNQKFNFSVNVDNSNYSTNEQLDTISTNLLPIYKWIISNSEYKDSYKLKLDIVRKVILEKKSFGLNAQDLLNCKSIFNRVIRKEVELYFEQVKLLKDDFINFERSINDVKRSLHVKILTWLGSIGLVIFDYIKDYNGNQVYYSLLFSDSEKIQIILIMLLFAFIIIASVFVEEMNSLKKEYDSLKTYYVDEQFFIDEDFKNYIDEPKINSVYIKLFFVVIVCFIVRFLVTLFK